MTPTYESFFDTDSTMCDMNSFEIMTTSPDTRKLPASIDSAIFVSRSNSVHTRMDAFFGDDIPMSPIKPQPFNFVPSLPVIQDLGDDETDALLKELLFVPSYDCSMISDACDDNSSFYSLGSNDSLGLLNLDSFQASLEESLNSSLPMNMSEIQSIQYPDSCDSYQTCETDVFSAMNTPNEERYHAYPEFQSYQANPYSGSYPVFTPPQYLAPILETPLLDNIHRSSVSSTSKHTKSKKLPPLITNFPGQHSMKSIRSAPVNVPYMLTSRSHQPTLSPTGPMKCQVCEKEFTRTQNLKTHMLLHYPSANFPCTDCDTSFRRLPDLRRHYKSVHVMEKQYLCPHGCGKAFSRSDALKRHMIEKSQGVCAAIRIANSQVL